MLTINWHIELLAITCKRRVLLPVWRSETVVKFARPAAIAFSPCSSPLSRGVIILERGGRRREKMVVPFVE